MKAPFLVSWVGGVSPNGLFSFSLAPLEVPFDDFCRNMACREAWRSAHNMERERPSRFQGRGKSDPRDLLLLQHFTGFRAERKNGQMYGELIRITVVGALRGTAQVPFALPIVTHVGAGRKALTCDTSISPQPGLSRGGVVRLDDTPLNTSVFCCLG